MILFFTIIFSILFYNIIGVLISYLLVDKKSENGMFAILFWPVVSIMYLYSVTIYKMKIK